MKKYYVVIDETIYDLQQPSPDVSETRQLTAVKHVQSHGLGNRTFNPASQIAGREKRLMASNVIMVADVILSKLLDSQTHGVSGKQKEHICLRKASQRIQKLLSFPFQVCPMCIQLNVINLHMCFEFCESVSKLVTYQQHDGS